jgi:spore coat protein CotH
MNHALTGCVLATSLLAASLEAATQDPSDAVYDETQVATYRITMAAADWNAIVNDPFGSGDLWKRCSVQWQSDPVVNDVAVHAVGTNRPSGNPKPAIRLKFDEFVPGREWRGVDNIKLEGNITEAFSERVAYWTHNQFGVEAPRAAHCRLFVNGDDKGVYCAIEPVRKKFVKDHFGLVNFDGNIYKIDRKVDGVTMTADQYRWIDSNPASYVPAIWEPITNEVGGNYSDVVGLLDILNNSAGNGRGRIP